MVSAVSVEYYYLWEVETRSWMSWLALAIRSGFSIKVSFANRNAF